MRIIGGKDYYDGAVAYGIDPGVVFVRDSHPISNGNMEKIGTPLSTHVKIIHKKDHIANKPQWAVSGFGNSYYGGSRSKFGNGYYHVEDLPIIFCGKKYSGLRIVETIGLKSEEFFFWTANKLIKWCDDREFHCDFSLPYWAQDKSNSDPFQAMDVRGDQLQALIDLRLSIVVRRENGFSTRYNGKDRIEWLGKDSGWFGNCDGLNNLHFQSIVDPYTAFQELSMWVGGTLSSTNGPNTVTITDDKVKIAKHGFDQASFRKPKA